MIKNVSEKQQLTNLNWSSQTINNENIWQQN